MHQTVVTQLLHTNSFTSSHSKRRLRCAHPRPLSLFQATYPEVSASWQHGIVVLPCFTNSQGFERQVRLSSRSSHSMNHLVCHNQSLLENRQDIESFDEHRFSAVLFSTSFVQGSLLLDIASTTQTISNSEPISQNCHDGFFKKLTTKLWHLSPQVLRQIMQQSLNALWTMVEFLLVVLKATWSSH